MRAEFYKLDGVYGGRNFIGGFSAAAKISADPESGYLAGVRKSAVGPGQWGGGEPAAADPATQRAQDPEAQTCYLEVCFSAQHGPVLQH